MVMIKLSNVSFAYDSNVPIVVDVSLSAPAGKVIAVMGPSGCGKTTLLRLVAGLLLPSQGEVQLLGAQLPYEKPEALRALRSKMGMLFQFGALFTDMSVFDNVAFSLCENTQKTKGEIKQIVMAKLESVGLAHVADKMPSEISGGMARRVALARAIAQDPKIMLFDEPFTGLDPIAMDSIARLIREQTNVLNAASVVVSHDIPETFSIADYVYVMNEAKIMAHGTPEQLMASKEPFIQRFIHGNDLNRGVA